MVILKKTDEKKMGIVLKKTDEGEFDHSAEFRNSSALFGEGSRSLENWECGRCSSDELVVRHVSLKTALWVALCRSFRSRIQPSSVQSSCLWEIRLGHFSLLA